MADAGRAARAEGDARRDLRSPGASRTAPEALLVERDRYALIGEAHEGAAEEGELHACFDRRELGHFVREVLRGALVDETAASEPPRHALRYARGDAGDLLARGGALLVKGDAGIVGA